MINRNIKILVYEVINIIMKERKDDNMAKEKNVTYNVNGGQVNIANDNSTMYVTQINNGKSVEQLDTIIKGIKDNLSKLKKEDAEEITDVVDMAKEELNKPKPKAGRLRNCLSLIAPMITIANGIPDLAVNLQRLSDYIQKCIG